MSSIDLNSLLTKNGLHCCTFAFNDLPNNIKSKFGADNQVRYQDRYLSLIANAGPNFWTALKASQHEWSNNTAAQKNPVDYFSVKITEQLLKLTGLYTSAEFIYPGTAPAPLIVLGELANWSTPSPLGLGLHSRYGPWFAYRALIKTTQPLLPPQAIPKTLVGNSNPTTDTIPRCADSSGSAGSAGSASSSSGSSGSSGSNYANIGAHEKNKVATSPCLSCASIACVSACPGEAVSVDVNFNTGRCATYRLSDNSKCKEQCPARLACPVGVEFRYSEEQRAYHMTHALQALVQWAAKD